MPQIELCMAQKLGLGVLYKPQKREHGARSQVQKISRDTLFMFMFHVFRGILTHLVALISTNHCFGFKPPQIMIFWHPNNEKQFSSQSVPSGRTIMFANRSFHRGWILNQLSSRDGIFDLLPSGSELFQLLRRGPRSANSFFHIYFSPRDHFSKSRINKNLTGRLISCSAKRPRVPKTAAQQGIKTFSMPWNQIFW
jgi:hypothetical protein